MVSLCLDLLMHFNEVAISVELVHHFEFIVLNPVLHYFVVINELHHQLLSGHLLVFISRLLNVLLDRIRSGLGHLRLIQAPELSILVLNLEDKDSEKESSEHFKGKETRADSSKSGDFADIVSILNHLTLGDL